MHSKSGQSKALAISVVAVASYIEHALQNGGRRLYTPVVSRRTVVHVLRHMTLPPEFGRASAIDGGAKVDGSN